MALSEEKVAEIKDHLLKQLDNFPEDRQAQIKQQIVSMTPEQVEAFVKQNGLTHLSGNCIFCSIVSGATPSYKVAENDKNIAILELNPLSKGHTLIVPKSHDEGVTESTTNLAEQIKEKLIKKFSPGQVAISPLEIMNHKLLEVVPKYGDEKERFKATEDMLILLQKEMKKEESVVVQEPQEKVVKQTSIPILKPRIP